MNRSTINMAGRLRLRRRSRGWLVVATAAAAVALPAATALSVAAAAPGASFAAYGADGTGTGVHVRVGTDAFPNFANGVVDNAYPLAVVHLDASPAAKATASVADTGPLGATAAGQAGTQQPQYADAAYPGTPSASKSTGASVADAGATETNADARSTLTAAPPPAPGSSTVPVPAPAPGLPAAPAVPSVPSAPAVPAPGGSTGTGNSGPFAVSNGVGEAHAVLDRAAGLLRATSIGSVSRATFANGLLAVEGVTVRVEARSDGAAGTTDSAIDVGRITVAGKNVALTDKGIVAADTPVPGVPTEAVTAQLRDALAKAGITLFSVAPVVDVQGASATIAATGLHVKVAQPPTAPGVPAQTVEYVIGEARASAFATPASPAPTSLDGATPPVPARTDPLAGTATTNTSTSDPSATLSDGGDSESSLSGFEAASTTASPASRSKSAAGAGSRKGVLARVLHTKPRYLLFAFLAWLCLIWGTAVALLRSRRIQLALAEVIDAH
jgi:hypothetical protein